MAAGVQIVRYTGASGATVNDITTINTRANAYDGHSTADTLHPIKIPASGSNYSYWVVTGLNVTSAPTGTINNIKWYTDGSDFGSSVSCRVGTASTYSQATGTEDTTGNLVNSSSYTNFVLGNANAFTYTSTAPLNVTGSTSGTGAVGHYVVYQIEVGSGASAGATTPETFTWQWDET